MLQDCESQRNKSFTFGQEPWNVLKIRVLKGEEGGARCEFKLTQPNLTASGECWVAWDWLYRFLDYGEALRSSDPAVRLEFKRSDESVLMVAQLLVSLNPSHMVTTTISMAVDEFEKSREQVRAVIAACTW